MDVLYDKKGNLTKDDDGQVYFYDRQNLLTRVEKPASTLIASYAYVAFNRRIEKDVNGGAVTRFYWTDGWQLLEETDDAGTPAVQRYYVWGNYIDELLLFRDVAGVGGTANADYFACRHHNYNIVTLLNSSGAVVERYDYNPYGQRFVLNPDYTDDASGDDGLSDFGLNVGHQGLMHDIESGLLYNNSRMYHPRLGRFTHRDLIGYADGANLYQYLRGDPINRTDSTGLLSLNETARKVVPHRPAGVHEKYSPGLMLCLLWKESGFDEHATNPNSTAKGIAQILNSTADDIQDRIGPNRFGAPRDPFYILPVGERLRDHRFNPDVSIYAAYMYLEDRRLARGGDWEAGVRAYGPNGDKVIDCAACCGILQFDEDYNLANQEEIRKCLRRIHE